MVILSRLPRTCGSTRRHSGEGKPFSEPEMVEFDRVAVRMQQQELQLHSGVELMHQVGGEPFWLDEEVVPRCTSCRSPMQFLLQLDSDPDVGLHFGDAGMLYAFQCGDCRELATFVQSF